MAAGEGGKAEVSVFAWPELPELFEAAAAAAPLVDYAGSGDVFVAFGRPQLGGPEGNLTWGLVHVRVSGPAADAAAWLPYPLLWTGGNWSSRVFDALWAQGALGPALDLMIRAAWGGEDPPARWVAGFLADAVGPYAIDGAQGRKSLDWLTIGEAWRNHNHGLVCAGWARVAAEFASAAGFPSAAIIGPTYLGEHAIAVLVVPSSAGLELGEVTVPSFPLPFDVDGDGLNDTALVIADTMGMGREALMEFAEDGEFYLFPPWGGPEGAATNWAVFPVGNLVGSARASWPEALRWPSEAWARAWDPLFAALPPLRSATVAVWREGVARTPFVFETYAASSCAGCVIGSAWPSLAGAEWEAEAGNASWTYPWLWLLWWGFPAAVWELQTYSLSEYAEELAPRTSPTGS